MADNYLNQTGLAYYHDRISNIFATQAALQTLSDEVDDIIAEGGEPNTIESITVNGSAVTPDANKNVALTVPTATSDLTNDGDGTDNNSPFATQAYVAANGGKIDVIKVNGTAQTITNKAVDISVPTATSDLTNDSDYQTGTEVQDAIDAALADITGIDFEVVQSLPQSGEKGVIYLVPNSGSGQNTYDEYIWVEPSGGTAHFEKIGSTDVDLSNYWTSTSGQSNSLVAITTAQIDTITA